MKYFLTVLLFVFTVFSSYSKWEIRNQKNQIRSFAEFDGHLYLGLINGMCIFNFKTKQNTYTNSIYSNLRGNFINSILKLPSGAGLLISSKDGLSMVDKNGNIKNDEPICIKYPDTDARYLYLDNKNNIWTYSSQKVYKYENDNWKAFDLKNFINFRYDIKKLFINKNEVWVLFNNLQETTTNFYSTWVDDRIRLLVIRNDSVVKTFLSKDDFPYRQGGVSLISDNKNIILKNYDGIYIYQDSIWSKTDKFNIDTLKPNYYYTFHPDKNGNIWYVIDNGLNIYRPVKFNIQTEETTMYLENDSDSNIGNISILDNGEIIFASKYHFYFKNDSGWTKVPVEDYGIPPGSSFSNIFILNGKKYVKIYLTKDEINLPNGTFVCLDDNKENIYPIKSDFPYLSITSVSVNNKGQGFYNGKYYGEYYRIEMDSGFVKPDLITNFPDHIVGPDGNVYFTDLRFNNSTNSPYIITWEGNDYKTIDMGFSNESTSYVDIIKSDNNFIAALGTYYVGKDSLNSTLSIYNFNTKELKTFDPTNSSMPDYYYERIGGIFMVGQDTIPKDLAVLPDGSVWIITTKTIINFDGSNWNFYDYPDTSFSFYHIYYDSEINELLFTKGYSVQWDSSFYFLNLSTMEMDSVSISEAGIKGKPIIIKEQIDGRIYLSDDKGYLYQYIGNGKFNNINLRINGKENIGLPINDFCFTTNNRIYLGTDIGLLYNMDFISNVKTRRKIDNNIICFPNPTSSNINIKIPSTFDGNCSISIFNSMGKMVKMFGYNLSFSGDKIISDINVSDLPQGIYFVNIQNKSRIITEQFILIK